MNFPYKYSLVFILSILSSINDLPAQIFLQSETKKLNDNKVISTQNEILIDLTNGQMFIRFIKPDEFYMQTNVYGEMTVYFPETNEVLKQRNSFFSSENELIYHFFTNQVADMGLSASGFTLEKSYYDNNYLVTEWKADLSIQKSFKYAKLVQEDYLPIYLEFYKEEGKPLQKIYFGEWKTANVTVFPSRITQIDFIPNGDSIISRKVYSNIHIGDEANSRFRKQEIPADAKPITR